MEVMEIQGYYLDPSVNSRYGNLNGFKGNVLLDEDGWFEGIVADSNNDSKNGSFVFGICHPDQDIQVFKFAPIPVCEPLVFSGLKAKEGYDGEFAILNLFSSTPCGQSHIDMSGISLEASDIQTLEGNIDSYKANVLDSLERCYYENYLNTRNKMPEMLHGPYEPSSNLVK